MAVHRLLPQKHQRRIGPTELVNKRDLWCKRSFSRESVAIFGRAGGDLRHGRPKAPRRRKTAKAQSRGEARSMERGDRHGCRVAIFRKWATQKWFAIARTMDH